MSVSQDVDSVREYVENNRDMLVRILQHGNEEARAYALALLLRGGTETDVEQVKAELDDLANS